MRPKVKYAVIYRHRNEYPVSVMCKFFAVSRSGYYAFVNRMGKPERDTELAEKIKECQNKTDKTYGTEESGDGYKIEIFREIRKLCLEL